MLLINFNYEHELRNGYIRIINNDYPKTYLPNESGEVTIINVFTITDYIEIEVHNLFINEIISELITT